MNRESWIQEIEVCGARGSEVEELLAYNENQFDLEAIGPETVFPLPDEPFVECWERWAEEAEAEGAFEVLRRHLPQLRFPISEGISQTPSYRRATLQGVDPDECEGAVGMPIEDPGAIELVLYPSVAGRVPVLEVNGRREFETLVRALSKKNEPVPVLESMGAVMISGYNNWARIHDLRRRYEATPEEQRKRATWGEEFTHIRTHRELYQDRFMLLSDGPYSAVPASELGLDEEDWRHRSLVIRRDHECTHYFTRRLFGSMRNNLIDELIADYQGIVATLGHYRADWFLRFVGLERHPEYREGGRLSLYRGDPSLSEGAFRALQALVVRAAHNLEEFDRQEVQPHRSPSLGACVVASLAALRLDELSSPQGVELMRRSLAETQRRLGIGPGDAD